MRQEKITVDHAKAERPVQSADPVAYGASRPGSLVKGYRLQGAPS